MNAIQNHSSPPPRCVAGDVVFRWLDSGSFPDRMLENVVKDRALIVELAYGTVRWHRALDWILSQLARQEPATSLKAFLLLGLYQIFFMESVEPYAIVNETVEAAKAAEGQQKASMVNAVLRRALREKERLQSGLARQSEGVRWSHPDVLMERWHRTFGAPAVERLCAWNNKRPDIVACVNPEKTGLDAFAEALRKAGVEPEPHPFRPDLCLKIPRGVRVEDLAGYREGWFTIQDPSTLTATDLLAPRPGEAILDACAAPGSKACRMAQRMEGRGILAALDLHDDRIPRLRENLLRTRHPDVRIAKADARDAGALLDCLRREGLPEYFDGILLDVPCTNTGVLRRRVDARWRFSPGRLMVMTGTQRRMLQATSQRLSPGGRMVYSTCSLEPEENSALIRAWLAGNPGFELEREISLFPPDTLTDGAYAALLRKKESAPPA